MVNKLIKSKDNSRNMKASEKNKNDNVQTLKLLKLLCTERGYKMESKVERKHQKKISGNQTKPCHAPQTWQNDKRKAINAASKVGVHNAKLKRDSCYMKTTDSFQHRYTKPLTIHQQLTEALAACIHSINQKKEATAAKKAQSESRKAAAERKGTNPKSMVHIHTDRSTIRNIQVRQSPVMIFTERNDCGSVGLKRPKIRNHRTKIK